MQTIQSFTGIINVIGRSHRVAFDGINGLTIENLPLGDAEVLVRVLEALDKESVNALLTGKKLQEAPVNKARWEPAPDRSRPAPAQTAPPPATEPVPETNEEASGTVPSPQEGGGSSDEPEPLPEPSESTEDDTPEDAQETVETEQSEPKSRRTRRGRVSADFKRFKSQKVMNKVVRIDGTTDLELKDGTWWKVDADRLEVGPTEAPQIAPSSETEEDEIPYTEYAGQKVKTTVNHSDGVMLVLEDGTRVKLDQDGKEVAVVPDPAPDLPDELVPADEALANEESEPEEPKAANGSGPPEEIMKTMKARVLIDWVLKNEVEPAEPNKLTSGELDTVIARCAVLRDQGAASLARCKDDASIRQRVEARAVLADYG